MTSNSNRYQTKRLASGSATEGPIEELTFSNLDPERLYQLSAHVALRITKTDGAYLQAFAVSNDADGEPRKTLVLEFGIRFDGEFAELDRWLFCEGSDLSAPFTNATSVIFKFKTNASWGGDWDGDGVIGGSVSLDNTHATLCELNDYESTDEW